MPLEATIFKTEVAGRPLIIETGELATQANGSVLVRYGDTVLLVTATASREPREGIDFFPLRVDWEERLYAAGRIPGSFFRREGRPTERAILSGRLTDRPIRPLFPRGFRNDVQVVVTVLSYDDDNVPESVGILGASCALGISDIPFSGPVAGVIVGRVDGELVINPTAEQRAVSDLDLTVAGTEDAILMIEAGAHQLPEHVVIDAVYFGHKEIRRLVEFQKEIIAKCGKEKMEVQLFTVPEEIQQAVEAQWAEQLRSALFNVDKLAREAAVESVKTAAVEALSVQFPEQEKEISQALDDLEKRIMRQNIITNGTRVDGRRPDEIRPISIRVGLLPRAHGSGLFRRGQTQVLTVAALGATGDRQMLDSLGHIEEFKRYMHHYNFPPYSVGEVRPIVGPGRREIGHGVLAERALEPVLPDPEEFPYTIRLVSEVLESNGSTSMGSVCGSTLALMDAGVPIKAPVAGIAMGLIKEGDQIAILTDIQGVEDALGDMDFKVAGTRTGVTAIQLDCKIAGLEREVLERALEQARTARLFILDKMLETLPAPRPDISPLAPRIFVMQIDPEKIRDVIGPGGKTIHKITDECHVKVDIEDDGRIYIAATDEEGGRKAREMIEQLTRDVQIGEVYTGRVTRLVNFGAFVEILPGKEGLVHISQLSFSRIPKVEDLVKVGDILTVKVIEIDELGRINLSRIAALRDNPAYRQGEILSGAMHEQYGEIVDMGAGNGERERDRFRGRTGDGRNRGGNRSGRRL